MFKDKSIYEISSVHVNGLESMIGCKYEYCHDAKRFFNANGNGDYVHAECVNCGIIDMVEVRFAEFTTDRFPKLRNPEITPTTDREKMLVEALLRKCRGLPVEAVFTKRLGFELVDHNYICIDADYRTPPTKADLILEEITKNMDESAAEVVKEAMELSPTLKGLCDE